MRLKPSISSLVIATGIIACLLTVNLYVVSHLTTQRFDPTTYLGTWQGKWVEDNGHHGTVHLEVTQEGDELHFACDIGDIMTSGLPAQTEYAKASIQPSYAIIEGHDSNLFGNITAKIDEHGSIALKCTNIKGSADSLVGHGVWLPSSAVITLEVIYEENLGVGQFVVDLEPKQHD